ncbi:hypothetical protein GOP47_0015331 [Adiantum capillus-veneris]|uniref:Uncharacterized protein n=1 Tax=Adiantum capillus-veneris TaxID=13818 RepID=A0A9D4UJK2_ADICA|nr:hypothetical protein GOP47_0015331 [Adiantum capillus-veneris]
MRGCPQQEHEDILSRLHKAHSTIAQILRQVDDLVLKAHRLMSHKQISSGDLGKFSELLEITAFSLQLRIQEWIPRFEDAKHRGCLDDTVCQDGGMPKSIQENKEGDKASKGKAFSQAQSENSLERLQDFDMDVMLAAKENVLSDSPLVPWFDKVQFFILTPMAKLNTAVSPVFPSKSSFKGQGSLSRARVAYAHADIIPVNLSPSLDTCADVMQYVPSPPSSMPMSTLVPRMDGEEVRIESFTGSAAATPAHLVRQNSVAGTETRDSVSPSCFQSLVKRYSSYFETSDHFSDPSPTPPITPAVKQMEALQEGIEITEYFTAFSPPRSLTPYVSRSERSPSSIVSANSPPQSKAGAHDVEHSTPMPFQSLMKRYPQFLHTEEERNEVAESALALTPMLVSSPLKTCILMRPNCKETAVKSRNSIQTPLLLLKSPFRTPGFKRNEPIDHAFYEDMDLTSLKEPGKSALPPESERRTPSSDMQLASVNKALNSIKRTPLIDLQLSTVRKPGAPLPGEQTLKRELWSRMEAEFASMAHVCKSLFTDGQGEATANTKVERAGVKDRQQKGASKLGPRGMQRRGSSMY